MPKTEPAEYSVRVAKTESLQNKTANQRALDTAHYLRRGAADTNAACSRCSARRDYTQRCRHTHRHRCPAAQYLRPLSDGESNKTDQCKKSRKGLWDLRRLIPSSVLLRHWVVFLVQDCHAHETALHEDDPPLPPTFSAPTINTRERIRQFSSQFEDNLVSRWYPKGTQRNP